MPSNDSSDQFRVMRCFPGGERISDGTYRTIEKAREIAAETTYNCYWLEIDRREVTPWATVERMNADMGAPTPALPGFQAGEKP